MRIEWRSGVSKEPVKVSRKRVNDVFIELSNWSAEVRLIEGVRAAIISKQKQKAYSCGDKINIDLNNNYKQLLHKQEI